MSWAGAFPGPDAEPPPWVVPDGGRGLPKRYLAAIDVVFQQGWLKKGPRPTSDYWENFRTGGWPGDPPDIRESVQSPTLTPKGYDAFANCMVHLHLPLYNVV